MSVSPVSPTALFVRFSLAWRPFAIIISVVLLFFTTFFVGAPGISTAHAAAKAPQSQPNHTTSTAGSASVTHLPPAPSTKGYTPAKTPQPITRALATSMKAGSVDITPNKATTFLGSDKRLELDIPAGMVTTSDITAAGGKISLAVIQITPASGTSNNPISLGTYLLKLVDSKGNPLNHGLNHLITLKFHYSSFQGLVDPDHIYVVFNGSLPKGLKAVGDNPQTQQLAKNDAKHQTITASTPFIVSGSKGQSAAIPVTQNTPLTYVTFYGQSVISSFGKTDPASTQGNTGAFTQSLPITTTSGPGGTLPAINLAYNSALLNQQHNPQGAASWVGEGWNLSLGQISHNEYNLTEPANPSYFYSNLESYDPQPTWTDTVDTGTGGGGITNVTGAKLETYHGFDNDSGTGTSLIYAGNDTSTTTSHAYMQVFDLSSQHITVDHYTTFEYRIYPQSHTANPSVSGNNSACVALDLIFTDGTSMRNTPVKDQQQELLNPTAQCSWLTLDSWNDEAAALGDYFYGKTISRIDIGYDQPANTGGYSGFVDDISLSTSNNAYPEDALTLSDPFGTNEQLIPPTTSTYVFGPNETYTPHTTSSPLQWHATNENYAKIYSFQSGIGLYQPAPCFRAYLANGIMEEFGCTQDSLQYHGINGAYLIDNWYLDAIYDSHGNQIHLQYQQDSFTNQQGYTDIRDDVLSEIDYDSPTCVNSQATCLVYGNTPPNEWLPLQRVQFLSSHAPTRLTNTPSGCNTGTSLRCDDPLDLSTSGGIGSPLIQNTFVLNDVHVDTYSNNTWNTIKDYQLSYEQSGPITRTDPATGLQESMAGMLDLTGIKVVGSDGSSALPATTFGYTTQTAYYEDSAYTPYSTSFCGPTWNTGNGGSCNLWEQSYDGNSRYLTTISNGSGGLETITWANARNNTHGSASPANPLYCNTHQTGYPCNEADDQAWSRIVLAESDDTVQRVTQNGQGGTQTTTPITSKYVYTYQLTDPLTAQVCADCIAGMYWGNQNDQDYLDFYNMSFMGFAQVSISKPNGSLETDKYYATEGIGVYDTTQVSTCATTCHNAPWWDIGNAAHGRTYEVDRYDTNGTTLLEKITTAYQAVCPPGGVGGSPAVPIGSSNYTWDGHLVSPIDFENPMAACDVHQTQGTTTMYDGGTSTAVSTTTYSYDTGTTGNYGRLLQTSTTTSVGASNPATVVKKTSYVWDDALTATTFGVTGTYLVNTPAFQATEDGSGNRTGCQYTSYDNHSYVTGQTSSLTFGNASEEDTYTNCGTSANSYTPSGEISTTQTYDTYGNPIGSKDADANAGVSGHTSCMVNSVAYTECQAYNATTQAELTTDANALNQTTSTGYTNTAAGSYGTMPTSATDPNSQQASITYDAFGRITGITSPAETAGDTTVSNTYTNWCTGTSAQTPCVENDTTKRLNSTTTVTTRSFYDGAGQPVETRTPAPSGQDVVSYILYNAAGQAATTSSKYFVTAYTGAPGTAAYSIPDTTVAVSTAVYDGLGRATSTTDALSHTTTSSFTIVCTPVTGDSNCYEQTAVIDANHHQTKSFSDGMGRTIYAQTFTGTSPYTLYGTTTTQYDVLGHVVRTGYPDGTHASTATYDAASRMTASTDPDLGSYTYTYDQNGNETSVSDPRGATGTVYMGYDGLNRVTWKSTQSNGSSPYATYTYDSTASGNQGKGHLTSETFASGPSQSITGGYSYTYDARGQQTGWSMTLGGTNYAFQLGYDDAGNPTTLTYPDGDVVTKSYGAQGWVAGVTETLSGTTQTLLNTLIYQGIGGANGMPTSAQIGNGEYTWSLSYDGIARPTETKAQITGSTTLFDQTRTYDAVGNVVTANTSLLVGSGTQTDHQTFCYDEQNRLTWAGATGTPSCGSTLTAGTLTSAQYQQSYSYDVMNRLTHGPLGAGYTYGDSTHMNAVTSAPSYTASYDTAGDMTNRNGQVLAYDALRQLASWQNTATSPTQTAAYAYDGEGQRVYQSITNSGTTTTTSYIGSYEDISKTGSTATTSKYYQAGVTNVVSTNGTLSYLIADSLGSVSMALSPTGSVQATNLFTPYGASRYNTGTMPTSYNYTGQRQDPSGLLYDHARYYDATVGQFISADNMQGPNRYGYVAGNPETNTDPTGNYLNMNCPDGDCSEILAERRAEAQAREKQNPPPPPQRPTTPTKPATPAPKTQSKSNGRPTTLSAPIVISQSNPSSTSDASGTATSSGPTCDATCQQRNDDKDAAETWIKNAKAIQLLATDFGALVTDISAFVLAFFVTHNEGSAASAGAAAVGDLLTIITDFTDILHQDIGEFWHNVFAVLQVVVGIIKLAGAFLSFFNPFASIEDKAESVLENAEKSGVTAIIDRVAGILLGVSAGASFLDYGIHLHEAQLNCLNDPSVSDAQYANGACGG